MKVSFRKKRLGIGKRVVSIIIVTALLLLTYLPIAVLVLYSFTPSKSIGVWSGFSINLYYKVFTDPEIREALLNSLIVGLSSAAFATLIGTAAAVGIFYMRKFPKAFSEGVGKISLINADIVTSIAFMLFFLAIKFIPDGYLTLIIAHSVICIPYVIMSVNPRLNQLNPNVYEAGLDLGASPLRSLFTVIIPQLVTGMVTGFALAFTISLDDFTIALFNNGSDSVITLPKYILDKMRKGIQPELRALSTLFLIIVMAILIIVNIVSKKRSKSNVSGLTYRAK